MTTPTPSPDVRELAARAEIVTVAELALDHLRRIGCFGMHESRRDELWQEARELTDRLTAAIARSHAHPEEGK